MKHLPVRSSAAGLSPDCCKESLLPAHKTTVDPRVVSAFLEREFSEDAGPLVELKGGEFSQAYRFDALSATWVVRVNRRRIGFEKDAFAQRRFASADLPIPRTALIGEMPDGLAVSITSWIDGTPMDRLSRPALLELLPDLLAMLDALHGSDTAFDKGFGYWDATGQARQASWQDHLRASLDRYRVDYRATFAVTHPVWELFRTAAARIETLLPYCPESHELVHGDIGFDNTLVRDGQVVGVIDWDRAAYGDGLSDIAWLSLWLADAEVEDRFVEHFRRTGSDRDHYHERIACYALLYGVDALRFYASGDRPDAYAWAMRRVERFLR